eukprot:10498434-Heterocapsa_arctica.AAC.1
MFHADFVASPVADDVVHEQIRSTPLPLYEDIVASPVADDAVHEQILRKPLAASHLQDVPTRNPNHRQQSKYKPPAVFRFPRRNM